MYSLKNRSFISNLSKLFPQISLISSDIIDFFLVKSYFLNHNFIYFMLVAHGLCCCPGLSLVGTSPEL